MHMSLIGIRDMSVLEEAPELYAAPAETTLALTAGKACVCCR